jgi:uncharacterized membrane protein YgaE (UPF0421/DUF939 family)
MDKQQYKNLIITISVLCGMILGALVAMLRVYNVSFFIVFGYVIVSIVVAMMMVAIMKFIMKE